MNIQLAATMIFGVLGGLGIFLLGMKNMSEGMQAIAGEKLRKLINSVTNNRLVACGVGTIITSLIQSSSVTTVMVVGMVNAGLMNLMQAIGVIMGANIGTTITAWILVLNIGKYGLPMIGIAAFFFLFSKRDRIRYTASVFLGVGMVFFGLQLMKEGLAPLQEMDQFKAWFTYFTPDNYFGVIKCVLVGAGLTAIVQSSSATVGITMALAGTGVIGFPTAAALVLGENIGTTITALLASLGATSNAKRAAYAHTLFNVIGVLWITSIFPWYIHAVEWLVGHDPTTIVYNNDLPTYPYIFKAIAATHTCFNVLNVLIFLPFIALLHRVLYYLVPVKRQDEMPHLTFLDVAMLDTPAFGIQQSQKEIQMMALNVRKMLDVLKEVISQQKPDRQKEDSIFKGEQDLDMVQKEIVEFLGHILAGNISHGIMNRGRQQLRMADEYESISDYITNILKLNLKLRQNNQQISKEGLDNLIDLHHHVSDYIDFINDAVNNENDGILLQAQTEGQSITRLMKDYRTRHLARVGTGASTPMKSLFFMDMLNAYRRIKDHALNIAEVLAGEK